MLYQNDAHHYRKAIRRRQRLSRIRGIVFLVLSAALALYAVPCFATSVFDYDQPQGLGTIFSSVVSDQSAPESETNAASSTIVESEATASAESGAASVSGVRALSDTVGPGMLDDEAAVESAKTRAAAMAALSEQPSTMVYAKAQETTDPAASPDILLACVAMALAVICAILGVRNISRSIQIRGRRMTAAYGHALRA